MFITSNQGLFFRFLKEAQMQDPQKTPTINDNNLGGIIYFFKNLAIVGHLAID
jgi:hypothetical protein